MTMVSPISQLTPAQLKARTKIRVYITEEFGSIFGEPVQEDEQGRRYADVPAHDEIKQYIKDLHPDWDATQEFFDTTGLELSLDPDASASVEAQTVGESNNGSDGKASRLSEEKLAEQAQIKESVKAALEARKK